MTTSSLRVHGLDCADEAAGRESHRRTSGVLIRMCGRRHPLAWAGLGVAAFHEYLVLTNVLECPQALLGIGTAPAQSLAMFVAQATVTTLGACCGRSESTWQGTGTLICAVILGAVMAAACVKSSPPLPPVPTAPYDSVKQPLDTCRRPFNAQKN